MKQIVAVHGRWYGWSLGVLLFLMALRLMPVLQVAWGNVGYVFLNRGFEVFPNGDVQREWNQRAEMYLQRAVDLPLLRPSAARGLGLSLAAQGKVEDAVVAWQLAPGMVLELLQLGHHARAGKQYEQAMQWYAWALALRTDWRDPVYYMGLAQAEMGRGDAALPYYETAVSLPPTSGDVTDAEIYCALAWVYHWLRTPRDPEVALSYYDLALTGNAAAFQLVDQCRFKRAELLLWSLRDFGRAVQDYEILSQRQPQNVQVLANLSLARYEQTGDLMAAEAALTAVTTTFPDSPWGYWRLADVYREAGIVDKAEQWYERTLLIVPGNVQVQMQLDRLEKP